MRRMFLFIIVSVLLFGNANADTPWWQHDEFCRISPTNCYATMGIGYEPTDWDITSNCWGKKYICADAIRNSDSNDSVLMGRAEIADASRIDSDFDVTILNGDCFGARKIKDGGTKVSVDGEFVEVWCYGALSNPDENANLENGEIPASGLTPTCAELKTNGYVGIKNGKCYGKYYNQNEYYIQCNDNNPTTLPTLVILNGVDSENVVVDSRITTQSDADSLFRQMYQNAQERHKLYFKD